ncbi:DUF6944 family repetitive protein [Niallia sp. NCCP-28]|uniref:DUF6944 family repetitive protein n=1 Tax=Niallia sp. NCCP-28 TaxID=2934712 RepID=UPI002086156E|nr:hypothetical protein [Niallia sp. NCCP-28]GKU83500.1 hypothetical protein NCCP28_28960 [Niallia sp. NCCP-28]
MNDHTKEILGTFLSAIGTIEAAIGNTPFEKLGTDVRFNLRLIGNALQASGSALSADGQGSISLEKLGDEIQAVGNSTVIGGLLLDLGDKKDQKLIITGTWLQALGSLVGLADEFEDSTESGRAYNIIGNLLQGIGNSMQAVGGIEQLKQTIPKASTFFSVGVVGSWIQATGSVISLIGQIKEEREEIERGINE